MPFVSYFFDALRENIREKLEFVAFLVLHLFTWFISFVIAFLVMYKLYLEPGILERAKNKTSATGVI